MNHPNRKSNYANGKNRDVDSNQGDKLLAGALCLMLRKNLFDLMSGAVVILVAVAFLVFMRWQTGTGGLSVYPMSIEMKRADQLDIGTDVRIAGVTVGKITSLSLEPGSYRIKAGLYIKSGISIPIDSRINVAGGMMSSPYVSIEPGRSATAVPVGGTLATR